MPELQLPCPPLADWLPAVLGEGPVGLLERVRPPRGLRSLLVDWPELEELRNLDLGPVGAGVEPSARYTGLVIVDEPAGVPGLEPTVAAQLRGGAQVVELVELRGGLLPALLGIERARLRAAERLARRAMAWSLAGLCRVEQWACPDPPDLVVTRGWWADVRPE